MYYKVLQETETFKKLDSIWSRAAEVNKLALELVESFGYKQFGIDENSLAGGISCIKCESKPTGFKSVGKKHQSLYYPTVKNTTALEAINSLPKITIDEYNESIGFKSQWTSLSHHRAFGCQTIENGYLVEVNDKCDYLPKPDMIEILSSEAKKLTTLELK
tara:strand:+ start:48 stop:530 length:483 start_codon:yes stop_codon:yes gene_type:complete